MKIKVPAFKGQNNAVAPRLIGNEQAKVARNCIVRTGNLVPLKSNSDEGTPALASNAKSLFLYSGSHWFSWSDTVHAARSPVAEDQYQRVYFTGDGKPKYTNSSIATGAGVLPFSEFELGLDSPDSFNPIPQYFDQSSLFTNGEDLSGYEVESDSGYINIETDDDETRFYICTYVSAYGEESSPSPISGDLDLFHPDDQVTLVFLDLGGFVNQNITKRRIYRTATSGDITQFFLVDEIPVSQGSYVDTKKVYELKAELTTYDYDKPPDDMEGLIITSNGVAIGFVGNTIVPSEAFLPYAYPLNYRQTLPDKVVALAEMSAGVVIATENKPAILQGALPDGFTLTTIDAALPCVSGRSMVDMGEAALYASHDGLVSVSQSGAQIITSKLLSKAYWRSLDPSSMHAYRYNDYYIAFYGSSAGFAFDLRDGNFFELDFYATTGYFDTVSGKLFLLVNGDFVSFDNGTALDYLWESKQFELNNNVFSYCKVRGESLSGSSISLLIDGVSIMTHALTGSDDVFRLPAFRANRLSFTIEGNAEIESVTIASSAQELKDG